MPRRHQTYAPRPLIIPTLHLAGLQLAQRVDRGSLLGRLYNPSLHHPYLWFRNASEPVASLDGPTATIVAVVCRAAECCRGAREKLSSRLWRLMMMDPVSGNAKVPSWRRLENATLNCEICDIFAFRFPMTTEVVARRCDEVVTRESRALAQ